MPDSNPLISVTLPNYNYGKFLAQAFETVLAQTYTNFEILFVDDGSTDESRAIAQHFEKQDSRIKAVYFEKNRGAMPAHANTWNRVAGEVVYQYSSDDLIYSPDFFGLGIAALKKHPDAGGFYGAAGLISTETGQLLGNAMGRGDPEGFINSRAFMAGFLNRGFFVPGISSLWRTSAIHAVGGYDLKLGPQADYFINHAIPAKYGVVYMSKLFALTRVSESRQSFSSKTTLDEELARLALFVTKMRNLSPDLGKSDADWSFWRRQKVGELASKYGKLTPAQPPKL